MGIGAILGRTFAKQADKAAKAAGAATKGVYARAAARTEKEIADCFVSRRALNQQKKTLKAALKDISKKLKASMQQESGLKEKLDFQKCAQQAETAEKLIQENAAQARKQVAEAMKNKFNGKMKVEHYTQCIKDGKIAVEPAGSHTLKFKDGKIIKSMSDDGNRSVEYLTNELSGNKVVQNETRGVKTAIQYNKANKPSMIYINDGQITGQKFNYGANGKVSSVSTSSFARSGEMMGPEQTRHINWLPDGTVAKYIS